MIVIFILTAALFIFLVLALFGPNSNNRSSHRQSKKSLVDRRRTIVIELPDKDQQKNNKPKE